MELPTRSFEQPVSPAGSGAGGGPAGGGPASCEADRRWQCDADFLAAIIDTQSDVAAVELDPDTVMRMIVDRTRTLTGAAGAAIEFVEDGRMVYRAACGTLAAHVGLRLPMASSLSGLCASTGDVLSCEDTETDPGTDPAACRRLGIRSMVVVPLSHNGRSVGVLKVVSPRPGGFDRRSVRGLRLMAGLLASSLGHAAEFEAKRQLLAERAEAMEALRGANDRLRRSEELFRLLAQNARDLIFRYEFAPRRRYAYVSPAVTALTGYTPEECYADPDVAFRIVHPDDWAVFSALIYGIYGDASAPSGLPPAGLLVRFIHRDGRVVWTEQRCVPIRDASGALVAVEGITRDVGDRVRAEAALRDSEERFRSAFDHAAIGMAMVSLEGRWVKVNRALCRIVGYTEAELLARDFQSITHPADLDADLAFAGRLLAGEVPDYQMVKRYVHRRGHLVWVLLSVSLVREEGGRPLYFISQVQDVTARQEAEDALRASEEEYRATFELAGVGKAQVDLATGRMVRVNRKLCEILGYGPDELRCMPFPRITHPDDAAEGWRAAQRMLAGEATDYVAEKRYVRKDGRVVWVSVNATVIRNADGRPLRAVSTIQDVTERRLAEALERDRRRVLEMVARDMPLTDVLGQLAGAVERQAAGAVAALMVIQDGAVLLHGPGLPPDWRDAVGGQCLRLAAALSQAMPAVIPVIPDAAGASASSGALGSPGAGGSGGAGPSDGAGEGCGVTYLRSDPIWAALRSAAERHGLEACWAVGIPSSDGTPLGLLAVFHREHRRPTRVEAQTMDMAGKLASICVEHHNTTRQLAHLVRHDPLTGLPNRLCFEDRLGQAVAMARRGGRKVAVVALDLDHFKQVNDTLGHDAGDALLQQFAQRLHGRLRDADTLARVGGDEFLLILPDLVGPEGAVAAAEKLSACLREPFPVGGRDLSVTSSMGIALFPDDGEDSATLQRRADEQLYVTKRRGRNGYSLASPP